MFVHLAVAKCWYIYIYIIWITLNSGSGGFGARRQTLAKLHVVQGHGQRQHRSEQMGCVNDQRIKQAILVYILVNDFSILKDMIVFHKQFPSKRIHLMFPLATLNTFACCLLSCWSILNQAATSHKTCSF